MRLPNALFFGKIRNMHKIRLFIGVRVGPQFIRKMKLEHSIPTQRELLDDKNDRFTAQKFRRYQDLYRHPGRSIHQLRPKLKKEHPLQFGARSTSHARPRNPGRSLKANYHPNLP